jgi:DNA-binding NtrC family response regulator
METLLLAEVNDRLRAFWESTFQKEGFEAIAISSSEQALEAAKQDPPAVVFLGSGFEGTAGVLLLTKLKDLQPDLLVLMPSNLERIKARLEAFGDHQVPGPGTITIDQVTVAIQDALELQKLRAQARHVSQAQRQQFSFDQIIGESPATHDLKEALVKVIEADPATVLISGETGTGKELVAKAIHYNSGRREKPFLVVDCAAIPATLLESELFGYEPGAFTDAKSSKKGLLEMAEGGSVFLDEIGEMALALQSKLLRVLEEKRFRRLGGTKDISVNVRFMAATNKPLEQLIKGGAFRQDLYFRLCVFPVTLIALRNRREDILPLVRHFIAHFNAEFHKRITGLSALANERLLAYDWPGNVRELRNVIERAVILEQGELLSVESLRLTLSPPLSDQGLQLPPEGLSLKELEDSLVKQALKRAKGNQTEAARLLGVSRFALRTRLKRPSAPPLLRSAKQSVRGQVGLPAVPFWTGQADKERVAHGTHLP